MNEDISNIKEKKRIIMSSLQNPELYPSMVSRCFGNIEGIIDSAFRDKVPACKVIEQLEDKIKEIRDILFYD